MDEDRALQASNHDFLRKLEREKRIHDYAVQSTKLLISLNSGSAIAVLAFTQALIAKQMFSGYKYFALPAILVYLSGAGIGATSLIIRGQRELHDSIESPYFKRWRDIYSGFFGWATFSFVIGSLISVTGIFFGF